MGLVVSSATLPASVWLVIAAYNEGERLAVTLDGLKSFTQNIIVVDDGSRDHSSDVAKRFPVWVLRHAINRGQGAALQTGIDFALLRGADIIVTFDADNQHDANDLPAIIAPVLANEVDIAIGSRFLGRTENLPSHRRIVLKLGVLFTRLVSRIPVTDTHNGFRAFSRLAAQRIRITQDRMAHASEILDEIHRQKLRYVEVPVTIRYSPETMEKGQSSWNAVRIVWQFLIGKVIR
jgi:polyprenyl-phospho-N-acetylgalactosaminyl synthase